MLEYCCNCGKSFNLDTKSKCIYCGAKHIIIDSQIDRKEIAYLITKQDNGKMIVPVKINTININQTHKTEQCGVFFMDYNRNMEIDINFGCWSFPEIDSDIKMKVISEEKEEKENDNGK